VCHSLEKNHRTLVDLNGWDVADDSVSHTNSRTKPRVRTSTTVGCVPADGTSQLKFGVVHMQLSHNPMWEVGIERLYCRSNLGANSNTNGKPGSCAYFGIISPAQSIMGASKHMFGSCLLCFHPASASLVQYLYTLLLSRPSNLLNERRPPSSEEASGFAEPKSFKLSFGRGERPEGSQCCMDFRHYDYALFLIMIPVVLSPAFQE
jgi:hypothetical protein